MQVDGKHGEAVLDGKGSVFVNLEDESTLVGTIRACDRHSAWAALRRLRQHYGRGERRYGHIDSLVSNRGRSRWQWLRSRNRHAVSLVPGSYGFGNSPGLA